MIFANFVYLIPVHYLSFISSIKEKINQRISVLYITTVKKATVK